MRTAIAIGVVVLMKIAGDATLFMASLISVATFIAFLQDIKELLLKNN